MKIAQFQDVARPKLVSVFQEGNICTTLPMYTRISEWVEVDFPPLPAESYLPHQLQALDQAERELREQLSKVTEARASLQPT